MICKIFYQGLEFVLNNKQNPRDWIGATIYTISGTSQLYENALPGSKKPYITKINYPYKVVDVMTYNNELYLKYKSDSYNFYWVKSTEVAIQYKNGGVIPNLFAILISPSFIRKVAI